MKNFKQPGKMLTVVAPSAGILAGQLVQKGDLVGVAAISASPTATQKAAEVALNGVFRVQKDPTVAMTQGQRVYGAFTNNVSDAINTTSSARVFVGWVFKDAGASDAYAEILLPLGGE